MIKKSEVLKKFAEDPENEDKSFIVNTEATSLSPYILVILKFISKDLFDLPSQVTLCKDGIDNDENIKLSIRKLYTELNNIGDKKEAIKSISEVANQIQIPEFDEIVAYYITYQILGKILFFNINRK